jgi:hypothetical protein
LISECESHQRESTRDIRHNQSLLFPQEHGLNTGRLVHLPAVSEWSDFDSCHVEALCVLLQKSLSVRMNMIQSDNGEAPSKRNACPQDIDWPGLRAAAVAIGIRRAARQAARDLPLDEQERFVQRAMKRCSRQKWLAKAQQDKADAIATSPTTLSADVRKGAYVLSELLAEDSRETRIGLSSAARNAAETFAKMPGPKVIKHAQAHRHITASSSQLHGWDEAQARGHQTLVNIQILNER